MSVGDPEIRLSGIFNLPLTRGLTLSNGLCPSSDAPPPCSAFQITQLTCSVYSFCLVSYGPFFEEKTRLDKFPQSPKPNQRYPKPKHPTTPPRNIENKGEGSSPQIPRDLKSSLITQPKRCWISRRIVTRTRPRIIEACMGAKIPRDN